MAKELEDKKGGSSKIYFIIVLIVLLLAVVAAAICLWQIRQGWGTAIVSFHRPSTTPSQTPDEYAGWKEFINSDYGYSIKYPDTAKITQLEDKDAAGTGLKNSACIIINTKYGIVGVATKEAVESFINTDNGPVCLATGTTGNKEFSEVIKVDGKEYTAKGYTGSIVPTDTQSDWLRINLDNGNKIEYGVDEFNAKNSQSSLEEVKEELRKIVKSYKNISQDNLSFYYNPKAKITFRYPRNWEIRENGFYKDSTFVTVVICRPEEPKDVTANCVQINMPQAPTGTKHAEIGGNSINIYTDNSQVVSCFDKIIETFKVIENL